MGEQRVQRRLAAILAADVVGYSRLMEIDEPGTLLRLKSLRREILETNTKRHGGRIFKTTGDGAFVEFPSAVDAVQSAIEIQRAVAARNEHLASDKRLELRIGVSLGDVIVEGDDLYGNGVNVAARMQTLAEPGGICISGNVQEHIGKALDVGFEDLGNQNVKNLDRPIRCYRLNGTLGAGEASLPPRRSNAPQSPNKPSIAVLPFQNMSGDREQEYFADGISEDIITALSKISRLFVVARNSSFTFKGKSVRVQEASSSLGVRFILEGSVRRAGNKVRITAQLVDGISGGHLWAERFDRDLTDIFAVQDEVTREIVSALALNLTEGERRRVASEHTGNLEAYDCFLRGREHWWRQREEPNRQARELLQRATELDPNFAPAHALLASIHVRDYANQWSEAPARSLEWAHMSASRAAALNDSYPRAHWALATVYVWMRRNDEAIAEAERAISLDPNFAEGHVILGFALLYSGRPQDAIACFDRGAALDPYHQDILLHFQAQARFHLGKFEEAIGYLKRRLVRNPETDISRVLLAACYGHLGHTDEARCIWEELLRFNPQYSLEHRRQVLPYKNPSDFEAILEGLRKAGLLDERARTGSQR